MSRLATAALLCVGHTAWSYLRDPGVKWNGLVGAGVMG